MNIARRRGYERHIENIWSAEPIRTRNKIANILNIWTTLLCGLCSVQQILAEWRLAKYSRQEFFLKAKSDFLVSEFMSVLFKSKKEKYSKGLPTYLLVVTWDRFDQHKKHFWKKNLN